MTKTDYNIRNSKSDLRLHNFREVLLGNKELSSSNKLTVSCKKKKKKKKKMSGVLRGNFCETCRNVP